MKALKIKEFCKMMNVSRDWAYTQIQCGRLPLVTFCGEPVKPYLIDAEKALALFSSTQRNVVSIASARSLKTESLSESVNHKPVTREDLWRD